jgi:hypothetical protein
MDDKPNCAMDVAMSSKSSSALTLFLEKTWNLDPTLCTPKVPRPLSKALHWSRILATPYFLYVPVGGPEDRLISRSQIGQLLHGNETLNHDNLAVDNY